MIVIGTAGYSYDDWNGVFYPRGLRPSERLAYYARHFSMVELNFSYYRMPGPDQLHIMQRKVPEGFEFIVKANQHLTHRLIRDEDGELAPSSLEGVEGDTGPGRQLTLGGCGPRAGGSSSEEGIEGGGGRGEVPPDAATLFNRALEPLLETGRLGGVLAQFPHRFVNSAPNRAYLARLAGLIEAPLFVEFRHESWARPEVFDYLRENGLALVSVDEPRLPGLMPPVFELTAEVGYLRLHGRNREKWWNHDRAYERYDYLYTREELEPWVERIRKVEAAAKKLYITFNNHHRAQSVKNARMLRELLDSS